MLIYLAMIDSPEEKIKFEIIYEQYKNLMFYTANKILGDTRDSEDIVHDAFLKIIEIIDSIDDPKRPQTRSLIVTITENRAIDLYRRRRSKTVVSFEEEYIGVPNQSVIEQIEDGELLSKAIASLPGKYREVLLMKYARGYSMDEIAEILSMSKENVKKTIQRARKKLSDYLMSTEQTPVFFAAPKYPAMLSKLAKGRTESYGDSARGSTWQSHEQRFPAALQ